MVPATTKKNKYLFCTFTFESSRGNSGIGGTRSHMTVRLWESHLCFDFLSCDS